MSRWYVAVDNTQQGPFSEEEVRAKLKLGELHPGSLCWTKGMKDWATLGSQDFFAQVVVLAPRAAGERTALVQSTDAGFASFGARVVARVVDGVITSGVTMAFGCVLGVVLGLTMRFRGFPPEQVSRVASAFGVALSVSLNVFYFGVLQAALGGTPGKLLCGIRLVSEDLGPIGIVQSLLRHAYYFLAMLPFGAGILAVLFDAKGRGWHDKLAGTVVVTREYLAASQAGPASVVALGAVSEETPPAAKAA